MEKTVTAHTSSINFKTALFANRHTLLADEPKDLGGGDTGPAPGELLNMALAACTAITLRMYAQRKGWQLEEARVEVSSEKTELGATVFFRKIQLIGALDESQRQRLMQVANACPVHKILTHPIKIQTETLS